MAAKKKQVETWTLADLGLDPAMAGPGRAYTRVLSATARPPRTAGEMVTDDGDGGGRLAAFLGTEKFI
jgi:electron transfer flavoprotein beta subunit